MKNTVKLIGIIAFVAVIGFTMVACGGGLSGSYSMTGGGDLTYTFGPKGKITAESGGKVFGEGTFTTKSGKLTISGMGSEQTMDYTLNGKELTLSSGGYDLKFIKN